MHPFPLLSKTRPKPLRASSQKREFHKLLKEAYLALEDDLLTEEPAQRGAAPLPERFHARPQPNDPAGLS